jgi:DNA-binding Lrp family transcriptional regulator
MSTTSLGLGLGIGFKIAWMKTPALEFEEWTKAAQRLWLWLKKPTHGDQTRFRFTDRELAKELGVGRRCVQYALEWLEEQGIIRRFKVYGPRDVAGRVIEIVVDLCGRDPTPKPTPKAPPAPPRPSQAIPQPAEAAPRRKPGDTPTPEEILNGQAVADAIRQAIAQSRQDSAPPAPTATAQRPTDRAHQQRTFEQQRLRSSLDSINRQLAQVRRLVDADKDPVIRAEIARLEEAQAKVTAALDQTTPARE